MREFVAILRTARSWRDVALVSHVPLSGIELAPGYTYQRWAVDNRNRNERLFIKALRNRAPFRSVLPADHDAGAVEYECRGQAVEGIGAAHLLDGLAVSLPLSDEWTGPWLDVTVRRLAESDDGDLRLEESVESVRHSARRSDVAAHESWGRSTGLDTVDTPGELWDQRGDFFPNLQFLDRVRHDLQGLQRPAFVQVRGLLGRLQASAALWDPAMSPVPEWQGAKITPEHEQRRRLCLFPDLDAVERCFDWHGRFTPGAGRLHFRLVPDEKALRVAYIGRKR